MGLSKKFTNVSDLRDVAVLGLKLEGSTFDTTVYNNDKDIQETAYKTFQGWAKRQKNDKKAYTKLLKALRKCSFEQIATGLEKSVENESSSSSSSDESE